MTGRQSPMRGAGHSTAAPVSARPQWAPNMAGGAVRTSLSNGYGSAAVLPLQPPPGEVSSAAAVSAASGSTAVLPAPAPTRTQAPMRGRSPSPMIRAPLQSGEQSVLNAVSGGSVAGGRPEVPRAMSSLHEQPALTWVRPGAGSPLPGGRVLPTGTSGTLSPQPPPPGAPYLTARRVSLSPDLRSGSAPTVQSYQPPPAQLRSHSPTPGGVSITSARTSFGGGRPSLGGANTSARRSFGGSAVNAAPDLSNIN